jgi:hypothetical protein
MNTGTDRLRRALRISAIGIVDAVILSIPPVGSKLSRAE